MTQSFNSDDLKLLFAYPFQDPKWKDKFLIGSVIAFAGYIIPILPFLLIYGYMAEVIRGVIATGQPTLPEWDDWGKYFKDGLKLFGVVFVWLLPLIILLLLALLVFFIGIGVGASQENGSSAAPFVGMLVMYSCFFLMMPIGMVLGLLLPIIMTHVVATGEFAAGFRVKEWGVILRANLSGFVVAYIVLLALQAGLSFALSLFYFTIILCCIVPFLMAPVTLYMMIIKGAVFGQAYREGARQVQAA